MTRRYENVIRAGKIGMENYVVSIDINFSVCFPCLLHFSSLYVTQFFCDSVFHLKKLLFCEILTIMIISTDNSDFHFLYELFYNLQC